MTDKDPEVRIVLTMRKSLVERIEDYRFAHRLLSRAAAVRELIEAGLRHPEPRRRSPKPPAASPP